MGYQIPLVEAIIMKKIILAILIMAFAVGVQATERSVVLIVKVDADNYPKAQDWSRRHMAQVYKTCATRNVDTRFFQWRGDADRLTAFIDSTECEFVFFIGSRSYRPRAYTDPTEVEGGDNIAHFWGQESAYCDVPAMVLFYGGMNDNDYYVSGAGLDNKALSMNMYFYTANYTGALDTLPVYCNNSSAVSVVVDVDDGISGVDSILTYAKYGIVNYEHYMGLWSRTDEGVIRYYCTLADGMVGAVIDAIMCKHITHFRKVQYAIDFNGFGKHYFITGAYNENLKAYTFPNSGDVALTHDNFFARIDSLTQKLFRYDMKASYITTTKFLKSYHADSNQWSEWWDLAQKYKDNTNIQWAVGSIDLENPDDERSILFHDYASYVATAYDSALPPPVSYMDSLYEDACDSIKAWGLTVAPYIATTNNLHGHYGYLQDSIITFLSDNNLTTRQQEITEESRDIGWGTYWDNTERNGVKIYLTMHGVSSRNDYLGLDERAYKLHGCFFQAWMWGVNNLDGYNPGTNTVGEWYDPVKMLDGNCYSTPQARINWFNFGACYNTENWSRGEMFIEELGKIINYLEWLAGKDLYECRFAQDIDWEQVR